MKKTGKKQRKPQSLSQFLDNRALSLARADLVRLLSGSGSPGVYGSAKRAQEGKARPVRGSVYGGEPLQAEGVGGYRKVSEHLREAVISIGTHKRSARPAGQTSTTEDSEPKQRATPLPRRPTRARTP